MTRMTFRRAVRVTAGRVAGGLGAVAAGLAVVALAEVQMARSGYRLPAGPLALDRPGNGPRIVWLGDSTAAGEGAATAAGAVPSQVQAGLGIPDAALSVLAVSGARAADVLVHQLPLVAARRPDLVLISVGANDAIHLTGAGGFRRTYMELVRALPRGVPVVLLGIPDMGAIARFAQPLRAIAGARGRHLDAEVRGVAAGTGAIYVPIAGPTGPAFRRDPHRYLAADDFHPSSEGYGLWADAVLGVLRREGLLRR
ncbi:MAG TPA: GDSL-type esterase/lipase family protein [Acidimicrobiia bacterium]|nr:GDSL-type esterase/lipase family protein [Acidimicrobiia bacterium]